jgi:hypothetical protein
MKAINIIKFVKYLELVVLVAAFFGFLFTIYGMITCNNSTTEAVCQDWGLGKIMSIRFISILLPIYGILNSLHIGLDHYINVGFSSYTNLFSIGLFGLSFSFILFAFFKVSPMILPIAQQNIVLMFIYITTALTSLIFLSDSKLWHRDSVFVKTRLLTSIIYLIGSSITAGLGVIIGLLVIPINILVNSKQE